MGQYLIDKPEGICANCKVRPATIWFVPRPVYFDAFHGGAVPWCELCMLGEQLEAARKMAANIPKLEKKIEDLRVKEQP